MSSMKAKNIIVVINVRPFTCVFVFDAVHGNSLQISPLVSFYGTASAYKKNGPPSSDPFRLIFLFCRLHRPEMIGEILRLGTVDQVEENIPCLFVSLDVAAVVVLWVVRIRTEYFLVDAGQLLFGVLAGEELAHSGERIRSSGQSSAVVGGVLKVHKHFFGAMGQCHDFLLLIGGADTTSLLLNRVRFKVW